MSWKSVAIRFCFFHQVDSIDEFSTIIRNGILLSFGMCMLALKKCLSFFQLFILSWRLSFIGKFLYPHFLCETYSRCKLIAEWITESMLGEMYRIITTGYKLQRLEKEGIISAVQFSEWAAPIVPVLKSDGHSPSVVIIKSQSTKNVKWTLTHYHELKIYFQIWLDRRRE